MQNLLLSVNNKLKYHNLLSKIVSENMASISHTTFIKGIHNRIEKRVKTDIDHQEQNITCCKADRT